jgi:acetoin utilization protein AcuB
MLAKELLSDAIIPVHTSDTAKTALKLMEDQKISHLPIVNNIEFLGLISEDDILAENNMKESVGNHKLSLTTAYVDQYQHIFEIMTLASELKLSIIPVIDKANKYLGSILLSDLLENFSKKASILNPGGIILLECNENDYSLEEIAHIVETNDAKILNCYISSHTDSTKMEVTLKLNKMNIYSVLKAFERYNYTIIASFIESDYTDDLQERYDSLMNYLNI